MINIFDYIKGIYKLKYTESCRKKVIGFLYENNIVFGKEKKKKKYYGVKIKAEDFKNIENLLSEECEDIIISRIIGIPHIIEYFKFRPGMLLGGLIIITVIKLLSGIIWDIRIDGNTTLETSFIESVLNNNGCSYGDKLEGIDTDKLQADILAEKNGIAWISIYLKGTVAFVQVTEILPTENGDSSPKYNNIVAKEDGIIDSIYVNDGAVQVEVGNVVKKGDLLISGVINSGSMYREGYIRYTNADGDIIARVNKQFNVSIPLNTTEKHYTGNIFKEKSVIFFKKSINISPNYGIKYPTYDKIVDNRRIYIFGCVPLPIWINNTEYSEFTSEAVSTDLKEIINAGYDTINGEINNINATDILSKRFSYEYGENEVVIHCDVVCLENISAKKEIYIE